jgi:hypothetical protein
VPCQPCGEEEAGVATPGQCDGDFLVIMAARDLEPAFVVVFPPRCVVLRRYPSGASWWLTAMGDAGYTSPWSRCNAALDLQDLCGRADESGEILSPTLHR